VHGTAPGARVDGTSPSPGTIDEVMNKLPNHTALKEWATAIAAIRSGEQIILIRKGGIADPTFGIEADRFYLFPTYFHDPETARVDAAEVTIDTWAEVVKVFRLTDLDTLLRLEPQVVFDRAALLERYRFRPDQALHVIAVRAWRLPAAVTLKNRDEYGGCRSWISVDEEIDVGGSTPALSEGELERRILDVEALVKL
jgi:hypothetical protein